MQHEVDAYIARFQNMPDYWIYHPTTDGKGIIQWYEVTKKIAYELVIDELAIPAQIGTHPMQLQTWGRFVSIAERSVQIVERGYRKWRDAFCLALMDGERKKPSEATMEKHYRVEPDYDAWNIKLEQCQESLSATQAIYDAFKAKGRLLESYAFHFRDARR